MYTPYMTSAKSLPHTAIHCTTLQHTATHCNTLQHTATHCNTLQHTATQHLAWRQQRVCQAYSERYLRDLRSHGLFYSTWLPPPPCPNTFDMCDVTHSYVWHDAFICVTWLPVQTSLICVTWLIHTCDMTHPYACLDSFIALDCLLHFVHTPLMCVLWLIQMCDMTHSCVPWLFCSTWLPPPPCPDIFDMSFLICVTWRLHRCDMTHS